MKFIKKLYILASLSLIISSCDVIGSISDIEQENVLTDETLITDLPSAQVALNGVYKSWRSYDISMFRNLMNVLTKTQNFSTILGENPDFRMNTMHIDNSAIEKFYTALYYVVNSSNTFIAAIEKESVVGISSGQKNEMIAQARFHRALAYTMLLRSFGEFYNVQSDNGVVLHLLPVRGDVSQVRATVAQVYEAILSDLDFAQKNAPTTSVGAYYITKTTASALTARINLYKNNYEGAITQAQKAIDDAELSGNEIEDEYLNIFKGAYTSKEILFAPYTMNPEQILMSMWSPFTMGATGNGIMAVAMELCTTGEEPNLMTGAGFDYRYAQTFAMANQLGTNGINKYIKDNMTIGQPSNTYYFLRMAEIYLIKAEALARLGKYNEAKAALKVITDRAKYPADYVQGIKDSDLLLYILKHKYLELMCENNEEWYDFVRYKVLDNTDAAELGMAVSMRSFILPIPKAAIAGNSLLKQNKDYE